MGSFSLHRSAAVVLIVFAAAAVVAVPQSQAATVFSCDFNSGACTGFSGEMATESVQGYAGVGTFGGDFLRNGTAGNPAASTILTLTDLPYHDALELNFLLAVIDSWDGFLPGCCSPDVFNVRVDGNLVFSEILSTLNSSQSYVPPAGGLLTRGTSLFGVVFADDAYDMSVEPAFDNIPHTSSTVTIEWFASGAGWQGGSDESWAIDNLEVNTILGVNPPPVANAGGNRSMYTGDCITLDGTAYDPDAEPIVVWSWAVESAPAEAVWSLVNETLPSADICAQTPGEYLVSLLVEDASGASVPDVITVTVADNVPPVAVASANTTIGPTPLTVQLDGSQSYDPEGAPLTVYVWDFGDGSELYFGATPPAHDYTDPEIQYVATLTVTDERDANDSDSVTITVNPAPNIPALPRGGYWILGILLSIAGAAAIHGRSDREALHRARQTVLLDRNDGRRLPGTIAGG